MTACSACSTPEAPEERRTAAERLLVDVGSTTIEITGADGSIELRERRED